MEDLLTADGAMNFVLQHNETIHGVSQRANEDWQAKVDEMIENQIDDIIIEELK